MVKSQHSVPRYVGLFFDDELAWMSGDVWFFSHECIVWKSMALNGRYGCFVTPTQQQKSIPSCNIFFEIEFKKSYAFQIRFDRIKRSEHHG